jgi:hypothetical protein
MVVLNNHTCGAAPHRPISIEDEQPQYHGPYSSLIYKGKLPLFRHKKRASCHLTILTIDTPDAFETHNGRTSLDANEKAIHSASALKLLSIGVSDFHEIEHVGRAVTEFVKPIHTLDDMIREIKKGNCRGVYIGCVCQQ